MNQKEKCRKGVVREENKERLIFFFLCTPGFSWDSNFVGAHIGSATAGAALPQRRKLGGLFPVLSSLMFLILICLNEVSPKGIRAEQGWAQQQSPDTWWLQTEQTPSPSASCSDITHPTHIRKGRRRIYLSGYSGQIILWFSNFPVSWCVQRKLFLCVVPPCNWKSSIPRKRLLVCLLCLLPGWPGLQPWASFSMCQQSYSSS